MDRGEEYTRFLLLSDTGLHSLDEKQHKSKNYSVLKNMDCLSHETKHVCK